MSDQHYYTPALEDIRVGMQLEVGRQAKGEPIVWSEWTISEDDTDEISNVLWWLKNNPDTVRVPYLTDEQIQAEGWKKGDTGHHWLNSGIVFKYILTAAKPGTQEIETNCPNCWIIQRINPEPWIIPNFQVFRGTIRCVNDLRQISKLLGI